MFKTFKYFLPHIHTFPYKNPFKEMPVDFIAIYLF